MIHYIVNKKQVNCPKANCFFIYLPLSFVPLYLVYSRVKRIYVHFFNQDDSYLMYKWLSMELSPSFCFRNDWDEMRWYLSPIPFNDPEPKKSCVYSYRRSIYQLDNFVSISVLSFACRLHPSLDRPHFLMAGLCSSFCWWVEVLGARQSSFVGGRFVFLGRQCVLLIS